MEPLRLHILDKCQDTIPHLDAVQLFLWLYCTLDLLPEHLRRLELTRETLSETFSTLVKEGKIAPPSALFAAQVKKTSLSPSTPEYWNSLVMDFMAKRIDLDESFPNRSSRYV